MINNDFLYGLKPLDEFADKQAASRITASVMRSVKTEVEVNSVNKKRILKPMLIAACIAAVGAGSLLTANAATNGALFEGITQFITVKVNGQPTETKAEITVSNDEITNYVFSIPNKQLFGEGEGFTRFEVEVLDTPDELTEEAYDNYFGDVWSYYSYDADEGFYNADGEKCLLLKCEIYAPSGEKAGQYFEMVTADTDLTEHFNYSASAEPTE